MKLMEIIKEKRQQIQFTNAELISRFEPQVRGWTETFNQAVHGSFAKGLFHRLLATDEEALQEGELGESLPSVQLQKQLASKVGDEIHLGEWMLVSQDCINQFSTITGDEQWIHVDVDRARRESPFRTTVAQGFLVLSLLPTLRDLDAYTQREFPNARLVMNCGLNAVRFMSPVKSNTRVRARTKLVSVTAQKSYVEIVEEVSIEQEKPQRCACVAETIMRVYL